jgi:hypothetical protein
MRKKTAAVNYGIGSLFGNTFNVYLYGSGLLTSLNFLEGLVGTRSIEGAFELAITYFISKLTPFPLNECLTGAGFTDVAANITVALFLGVLVASFKYRTAI